MVNSEL